MKGGLGNQMFQYAAARALSIRTKRELAIDAFTGFELDGYGRQYALADFALLARVLALKEARQAACRTYFRTRLIREVEDIYKNNFGRGYVGALHGMISSGDFYLDGYWQSEKYFADSAATIRSELTCTRISGGVSNGALSDIFSAESVSIHVRRNNYPVLCSESYYRAAADEVCRRIAKPRFFFFGDDRAWIESLIVNLRLPFPCVLTPKQESDLADFELMRACKHHIISNSTFSWWSAWLSESERTVVVAPVIGWSGKRALVKDVVPPRWIAL